MHDSSTARMGATEFVERLDELGYYRYAQPEHVARIKQAMIRGFDNPNGEFVTAWDLPNSFVSLDYRMYGLDGEALFETDGVRRALEELKPYFERIGLAMEITNHVETWDREAGLNQRLTLNGREYILFANFTDRMDGWGLAAKRFAEMLNSELERHGMEDRAYLISGGNDGHLIMLSDAQFRLIDSVYTNDAWKPHPVDRWWRVMTSER